ncbi:hypothetical protein [Sphingorhabdus sp. EL138]|uniref:hypothetical protein n=1 Tax=Sphingorhabdus sp. EL138 TaxID=2073156 RepID=UPI0025CE403D|nr:hypothetical protein [Sphingorhabdus sp. EL138]
MANEQELSQQLTELQQRAEQQHTLAESSRELLHRNLAETYFWWREARNESDYLDRLYAANNITYRNMGNRYNFSPIVRLAFPRIRTNDTTVSYYSKALWAIDNEFVANPKRYDNDKHINVMKAFIHEAGGVDGLKELVREAVDGEPEASTAISKKAKKSKNLTEDQALLKRSDERKILTNKTHILKASKGFATVDAGALAATNDDLVVLIAKRNKRTGKITLIASTTDTQIVEAVINECGELDLSNTPPVLRLLIECLRPQMIPSQIRNLGISKNFITEHKIGWDDKTDKAIMRPERARLVIRTDGSILVSKTLSDASLTTISIPKNPIAVPCDILLRGSDRYWIENILMNESQLPLFSCEPSNDLIDADEDKSATKQLKLVSQSSGHSRNIYFYDTDLIKSEHSYQPIIVNDSVGYAWEIKAKKKFIDRFYRQSVQGWLSGAIKHLKHKKTSRVAFAVGTDHLELQSHYESDNTPGVNKDGFTHYGDDCKTLAERDAVISLEPATKHTTIVAPLDIIELFTMLARAPTVGDEIIIRGNEFVLNVSYETATAKHEAYIPALDERGNRNDVLFARYNNG